jgi:hypothetical protein
MSLIDLPDRQETHLFATSRRSRYRDPRTHAVNDGLGHFVDLPSALPEISVRLLHSGFADMSR